MTQFVEITASKFSLARRKPLKGVGINDANYMVKLLVDGKKTYCPYYTAWSSMIDRCYGGRLQQRRPTYIGCSVVDEWLTFSNFKEWMKNQDWKGKHLDKDVLRYGNKTYSPSNCIFISSALNNLIVTRVNSKGVYPQGVCLESYTGKYLASCGVGGKYKNLGRFDSVQEAELAYLKFKSEVIRKTAYEQEALSNQKIQEGLLRHADVFMDKAIAIEENLK